MSVTQISKVILKREVVSYLTMFRYYLVGVMTFVVCYYLTFFYQNKLFYEIGKSESHLYFQYLPWLIFIFVLLIVIKQIFDEWSDGRMLFLFSLPINEQDMVLGRYLAASIAALLMVVASSPVIVIISMMGDLDWGVVVVGHIGIVLVTLNIVAMGVFFSSISNKFFTCVLSFITIGVVLLVSGHSELLEQVSKVIPGYFVEILGSLGMITRYEFMSKGVIRLGDLLYFVITTLGWLLGAVIIFNRRRVIPK